MTDACACIIDMDYDGEPCECFSETWPKAKKEYFCCECGEPIKPGEVYQNGRGKWDGHWGTYRTCKTCAHIRGQLCCGGYVYGGLREAILDALGTDYVTGESWYDDDDEDDDAV